jgi:Phasin protein
VEQRQAQGEQGLLSKQVTAELAAIGQQRLQDFVSAQVELLHQLRALNEIWLNRLRSDVNLASEFTAKLTESRSIPEAMSASQEWTMRRLQMMAADGQQLATVIQKLAETSARLLTPHELVMRILKLRWIGMENEAEKMETALHRIAPESTLVHSSADTD